MVALIAGVTLEPERVYRLADDLLRRRVGLLRYGHTIRLLSTTLHQTAVYPVECLTLIDQLVVLRRQVHYCSLFFDRLPADLTEMTSPGGCKMRLQSLSMRLSETVIDLEMFFQVCDLLSSDRLRIHTHLLALLPALQAAYDDVVSQLAALAERARVALEVGQDEVWDGEEDADGQ